MKRCIVFLAWLSLTSSIAIGLPPSYANSCAVGGLQIDTGRPAMVRSAESGETRPARMPASVLFPAPFSPTSAPRLR